jgi:ATPase subunit of ABC transporter with duplicated ATPase domains
LKRRNPNYKPSVERCCKKKNPKFRSRKRKKKNIARTLNSISKRRKMNLNRKKKHSKLIASGMQNKKLRKKLKKLIKRKDLRLKFLEKRRKFCRRLWRVGKAMKKFGDLLISKRICKCIEWV